MAPGIGFNSKATLFFLLSNFYGGSEEDYQSAKYQNKRIRVFFESLKTIELEEFKKKLSELTGKPADYWVRNGQPIRGILAKMLGGAVSLKSKSERRRRLRLLAEWSGLKDETEIRFSTPMTKTDKSRFMKQCLRRKFKKQPYRDALLKTDKVFLYERPMRGNGNLWSYRPANEEKDKPATGENLLGKLLMEVRDENREEGSEENPNTVY